MKKSELKKAIKPLVKECIHEILLEEGLLSNVVSEVARGLQPSHVVEPQRVPPKPVPHRRAGPNMGRIVEQKRKLMDAIGKDAYNGVNLFEDTAPLAQQDMSVPSAGSVDLGSPGDAGVDIGALVGDASKIWSAMK